MRIRDLVRLPFASTPQQEATTSAKAAPPGTTADCHYDGSGDDDYYEDRRKTAVYDPTFVPDGGWDTWDEWAIEQGKIARIIQSRAKNAMSFKLVSDDEEIQKEADRMARKVHLATNVIQFFYDREGRSRGIMEPVWTLDAFGRQKDLAKINLLYPPSVRVFRDNDVDVSALKEYLKNSKIPKEITYGLTLKVGSGYNIIGFIQSYAALVDASSAILAAPGDRDRTVFFFPDELIFVPRYPTPRNPNGISLPQQCYVIIMNKLGIECDQAIMARRHGDPKHKFTIPANLWHKKDDLTREFQKGIRAGMDFFVRGREAATDPDPMNVDIIEPRGNPIAVFKAQDHVEDQFIAAMGFADSFTESGSSNRSVGEIQLQFFERDLAPERRLIAEILEDQLIGPWLKAKGFPEGSVWFEFEDLTPDDRIAKATLVSPLIPYLPASVLIRFLEDLGYPLTEEEKQALKTPAPAAPQDPAADPNQQPAPAAKAALAALAASKLPRPVLQTAKPAQDQFKKEIEDMRDDIANIIGL